MEGQSRWAGGGGGAQEEEEGEAGEKWMSERKKCEEEKSQGMLRGREKTRKQRRAVDEGVEKVRRKD